MSEKSLENTGADFDFEFDEDFEAETRNEYRVMNAMAFDHQAGTAACGFDPNEDLNDNDDDKTKPSS